MSQLPRILLLITELDPGGAERVAYDLACGLRDFTPTVAALSGEGEYADRLRAAGIEVIDLGARSVWQFPQALLRLRRLLRHGDFSLLHTHLYHAGIIGRLAAAGTGVPVLSTCHIVERRRLPWRFWLDRLTAPLAKAEICVSEAVKEFQCQHTGLPPAFFSVIHNGIDLTRFSPASAEEKRRLRAERGWPEDILLAGFLGRFDRQKGVDVLLRALLRPELAGRRDFALVLGGYGAEEKHLRALAGEVAAQTGWHVADSGEAFSAGKKNARIVFAGYQPEPAAFLRCLDVCVVPSRWEGFGLVPLEAQACGVPVIASRVDSLPEVVRGGGVLVAPEAEAELAQALTQLLADPALRAQLSTGGMQDAKRFSLANTLQRHEEIYRLLIRIRDKEAP